MQPAQPGYAIEGDHLVVHRAVVEKGEAVGTVYVKAMYDPWTHVREYLAIVLFVMALSMLVAAIVSGWLQRGVTLPILEVSNVAREVMTRRDYSLRARKTTEDEIGELVESFNAMLAEAGRREQQLHDADRRKDEFLATLAHELRNPLAPIRTALEILRVAGHDTEMAAKAREMMARQLRQMVRLVDDLLDVSRITTGKLEIRKEQVTLQSVVQNAIETARPFIEQQRHRLEVNLPPDPVKLEADPTRLAQVFSNLLHNAAKYTPPEGVIELTGRREKGNAVVVIRDNGVGIAPEMLDRIFEMFVQADRSLERMHAGLGVGLTLSKRLVELHGGTIEARSTGLGMGSEFTVRVPIDARVVPVPASAKTRGAGTARHRVLLADDNVDFVKGMEILLSAGGHDVRTAYDGEQALKLARDFRPEIAFIDIGMPKVNGYEVARRLREQGANCLLVAVTGWGQEDDRRRAREAGFDQHLVKPVDPAQIRTILDNDDPVPAG